MCSSSKKAILQQVGSTSAMLKVLVLAAELGQSTGSALTQSMDSELAQRGRALNTIDPSPTPPPIPPPIAPPIPPPLTCPEAKPDGACEPALAGLTCEYGPVWCSCPIECQPCGAEEKSCVNSTKATCREEPGGDSDTRWSIVISEPLAPPCPPPAKSPKPPPSPESPPPSPPSSPPPQPPPSPPPPSPPPFQCPDLTLHTRGWQMVSFYCAGTYIEYRTLNDIMKGIPFEADDQILLRHPQDGLVFATFTGTTWVGNLVKRGLSYNRGYMVRYSGPLDAVINQTGYPGIPGGYVEKPVLKKGWNYIGVTCPRGYL